ncbi:MAG: hypothetical protein LBS10_08065 [Gracilibacteraceae bacterium]|nr:hypothetical protein [Gracilibacteraceae bacterium]
MTYQRLGDSLGKSLAIRPLVFGTIAIVPYGNTAYGNTARWFSGRLPSSPTAIPPGVYGTIAIVPYALPIVHCELCIV